jgi:hypothetical protein
MSPKLEPEQRTDDSGLEQEEDLRGPEIDVPFDPSKIDIIVKPMTISALKDRLENNELDLTPEFQRQANVWDSKRKSRLIESILLRIPLPSFYFSEDEDGSYAVVDGLQRLCAVFHFIDNKLLNRATEVRLSALRLQGLQYLKELEDATFDELDRKFQRRISELEITSNIIRASTPPAVKFNVFARLNQGGMPLNAQEIRNAIFPGEWRKHLRMMAESNYFLTATEHKIRTERQQDMELVLRFLALWQLPAPHSRPPSQTLDEFLNGVVENDLARWTKSKWERAETTFKSTMAAARSIFGHHAFRKSVGGHWRSPINRGLFEAQLVALSDLDEDELALVVKNREKACSELAKALSGSASFGRALLYGTGSSEASNIRLQEMARILKSAMNA